MSIRFIIKVDDNDRLECPDTPFTATVWRGESLDGYPDLIASGIGATEAEALADINWHEIEEN